MSQATALRDWSGYDRVGAIIQYEGSEMSDDEMVRLFQHLVDTGMAWQLQGHYGRTATRLIDVGLVAPRPNLEPLYASVEAYVEDNPMDE